MEAEAQSIASGILATIAVKKRENVEKKNYNRETVAIQQKILEEKNWIFCFKSVNYHAKNVVIIFYRNFATVLFFGGGEFSATLTSDFESGLVPLPHDPGLTSRIRNTGFLFLIKMATNSSEITFKIMIQTVLSR